MKVSVIIPVYNVEDYVEKSVKSVIEQSYHNIEIITINDGSTDGSLQKLYKLKDVSDIVILNQENMGLSRTRNRGIEYATGDAIFFLDSDDWISKDTIKLLVESMKKNRSDIAICGINYISQTNISKNVEEEFTISGKTSCRAYLLNKYDMESMVWNKLYLKGLFSKVKFEVDKLHEDNYFTPKILYNAKKVSYIPYVGYNYITDREDSIMNKTISRKNLDGLNAEKSNYHYFINNNEIELAELSYINYHKQLTHYYCLFKNVGDKKTNKELSKEFDDNFKRLIKITRNQKDIMSLVRFIFFKLSNFLYYELWRKVNTYRSEKNNFEN